MNTQILNTFRARKAIELHKNVPADWYEFSVKHNIFQRFWHTTRFRVVGKHSRDLTGKILDIGCCDGLFTKVILDNSKADSITGIDVLEPAIRHAQKRYKKNKKLHFQLGEAHKLPFKAKTFDHVFCLEALEHVEDPSQVIKEMRRVLKPGGSVHILVPRENTLFNIIWFFWTKYRGKIWNGTHIHDYTPEDIRNFLKIQGFTLKVNHPFMLGMLQFFIAE